VAYVVMTWPAAPWASSQSDGRLEPLEAEVRVQVHATGADARRVNAPPA